MRSYFIREGTAFEAISVCNPRRDQGMDYPHCGVRNHQIASDWLDARTLAWYKNRKPTHSTASFEDAPMTDPLSITRGPTDVPLLQETISHRFRNTVETHPSCEAIVVCHQQKRVTYQQLWDDVSHVARGLLAVGVQSGERVGVWSANCYEWVLVQFATARIGAILVNINPAYREDELLYALRQSGTSVVFAGDRFKQTEYAPMLETARRECGGLKHIIRWDRDWSRFLDGATSITEADVVKREAKLSPEDAINIQYTSGTTGFPKGATLTHSNILNNGYHTALQLGYTERDRVCVPVPFYHCFGMVLGTLACAAVGACVVVPSDVFQPEAVLEAVERERCTSLYGVPTMFRAVLEHPEFSRFRVDSLRTGIMAGSPCPIELMKEVVAKLHMPEIAIAYGMTETSPLSTISQRDDSLDRRVGTVGRCTPHIEISIRDADNHLVPRGTPGEFCARGYHVMQGYWNDETATCKAIDADGWMHSGDQAVLDEEGYVRITGRLKDLIIRGGENIGPREVEGVLEKHPAVSEAQVVGVPSIRYGEEVMAWIKFRPGTMATEDELTAFCKERMASFKVPKYWRFVEAYPMTVTGKIQKYRLRELAIDLLNLYEAAAQKTA